MTVLFKMLLALLAAVFLTACATVPEDVREPDTTGLARTVSALDASVSQQEAQTVAQLAYSYPLELRTQYNVTDGPLVHNAKVNSGLRPRGLCWHWADDLEARLRQEEFQTLTLHRAIANHDNIRIEHSTVVISAKGQTMAQGVVLDPWRYGGHLFWAPVAHDTRYNWEERTRVFAIKDAKK